MMSLVLCVQVLLRFALVDRDAMRMGIVGPPTKRRNWHGFSSRGVSPLVTMLALASACTERDRPETHESGIFPAGESESSTGTESSGGDSSSESEGSFGSSSSSTGIEEPVCGESTFVIDAVPPNVVLVLDKSGSMGRERWDADGDPDTPEVSRWRSLHNVVSFIADAFDGDINFGAVLFPAVDAVTEFSARGCRMGTAVDVPVAPNNAEAVLATIPSSDANSQIQGGTPATAGIRLAAEHLRTLDPEIPRFMILVTDGAANCGDDFPTCSGSGCEQFERYDENLPIAVGHALAEDGIATFVVGIDIVDAVVGRGGNDGTPEANTFEKLNEVAEAGGRARPGEEKFFNALNETELQTALSDIAGQVVSCQVPLDPTPGHPSYVSIEIDGQPIDRIDDCEHGDGWVFAHPDGPFDSVTLCNAACTMLVEHGNVNARYGCPPAG